MFSQFVTLYLTPVFYTYNGVAPRVVQPSARSQPAIADRGHTARAGVS
jgi:hypothetical protein